jgi:hypothetical protein
MLRRLLHGHVETISGTVYGTIVVLSMLVAGARDYESDPWRLVVIVATGATVLWAAHVYAHGLGESVKEERRLTPDRLLAIAAREGAILLAAVLPVAAIALGALSVLSSELALWLAVGVGVAALAVQAVRYARVERLGPAGTAGVIALNISLGLVFVGLKALFAH